MTATSTLCIGISVRHKREGERRLCVSGEFTYVPELAARDPHVTSLHKLSHLKCRTCLGSCSGCNRIKAVNNVTTSPLQRVQKSCANCACVHCNDNVVTNTRSLIHVAQPVLFPAARSAKVLRRHFA